MPAARPREVHTVPPPVDSDQTVKRIAEVLLAAGAIEAQVKAISALLAPYRISAEAVRLALSLVARGTVARPDARLAEVGAQMAEHVRVARDREVYFRAAYVANAASRLERSLREGESPREAIHDEAPNFRAHEKARRGRLRSASQVEVAARMFGQLDDRGHLVGWYLNPFLHNEVECITANGHNFYAEEGTVIGLPGSVHGNCGCYAGPPHYGATLVNDELSNVVKFQRTRPRFKLKGRRTA